ncbi:MULTISPECIES: pyridoxamine 5'-phosphate oxidase family protein [Streptomyces]|uniref:Pyridoxamine 5'-phosphate oxidase family protein n=1 Tax=Streptomyces edwardsiae TaxID=3075527 RepID=A0ABU2QPK0_9ACTN|nr:MULTISPECIES: pyridoxamine 5'-phosphate oxidase family protein [unclassified Streptomyces]MDT0406285.1 pyridoxamine 5'-phosphate oxidase family protein [Streptomyces sp. DSM 41635]
MGTGQLEVKGRAIIDGNRFMTLGTANAEGDPWVSPVFYVADGYATFYWISSPEATQVRNIAVRPRVGIVVFNSQQEPGSDEAVYMSATACELAGADLDRGLEIYLGAAPFGQGPAAFRPPGRYRAYRASVTEHFMLCPQASGEPCPTHGRTSDHRMPVTL